MPELRDLTGQRFGRLTVQWPVGRSSGGHVHWLYLCDCGQVKTVRKTSLVNKHTRSCGCFNRESLSVRMAGNTNAMIHGHSPRGASTPEYRSWKCMVYRCTNSRSARWGNYGGAGVKIIPRWRKFENFLADMGTRLPYTSLGRFGDKGNYEPGNVKWMTQVEQVANRKKSRGV